MLLIILLITSVRTEPWVSAERTSLEQRVPLPKHIRVSCFLLGRGPAPVATALSRRHNLVRLRCGSALKLIIRNAASLPKTYSACAVEVRAEEQHDEREHLAPSTDPSQGRHRGSVQDQSADGRSTPHSDVEDRRIP